MVFKLTHLSKPVPKGGVIPKASGTKVWCHYPPHVKHAEKLLRAAAVEEMKRSGFPMLNCRCYAHLKFYVKPTSTGRLRGDLDKLVRLVYDALTGVVFTDDEDFVGTVASKHSVEPNGEERTEISISVAT